MHEAIGEARGAVRARKTPLQEMLEALFGPLPESAQKRIAGATPERLNLWLPSGGSSVHGILRGLAEPDGVACALMALGASAASRSDGASASSAVAARCSRRPVRA